jgi:hypothetical protein
MTRRAVKSKKERPVTLTWTDQQTVTYQNDASYHEGYEALDIAINDGNWNGNGERNGYNINQNRQ